MFSISSIGKLSSRDVDGAAFPEVGINCSSCDCDIPMICYEGVQDANRWRLLWVSVELGVWCCSLNVARYCSCCKSRGERRGSAIYLYVFYETGP